MSTGTSDGQGSNAYQRPNGRRIAFAKDVRELADAVFGGQAQSHGTGGLARVYSVSVRVKLQKELTDPSLGQAGPGVYYGTIVPEAQAAINIGEGVKQIEVLGDAATRQKVVFVDEKYSPTSGRPQHESIPDDGLVVRGVVSAFQIKDHPEVLVVSGVFPLSLPAGLRGQNLCYPDDSGVCRPAFPFFVLHNPALDGTTP